MNRWKATALLLMGILVGVVFARPQVSGADGHQQQFRECAALRLSAKTRKVVSDPVPIPAGWTAVGGGGTEGAVFVTLCR
jgi:hypothetical protein